MEPEETFEDYHGNSLAFGLDSIKMVNEKNRRDMADALSGFNDQHDDAWELQKIHQGHGLYSARPNVIDVELEPSILY